MIENGHFAAFSALHITGKLTRRKNALWVLGALLFGCSLPLPAISIGDSAQNGFTSVIYGWLCFPEGVRWVWLTNPLCIITLVLLFFRKKAVRRVTVWTAAAAFLLSLSFMFVNRISDPDMWPMVGLVTRSVGYWIWACGMGVLRVAAILNNKEGSVKSQAD